MSDGTLVRSHIEAGDSSTTDVLPKVYGKLLTLAAQRLGQEQPKQAWQATASVLGSCIRLLDVEQIQHWGVSLFGLRDIAPRRTAAGRLHSCLGKSISRTREKIDSEPH